MTDRPFFSIVLSTFGRGRHIAPTIESVLRQSFGNFELIVVGDGCADDTEATVRSFPPERISWRNLARNSGSQSFPNNEGIRSSRGAWIAYLGHDDIWAPDHLACIAETIASRDDADVVVSGCVYYGPTGSDVYYVTGLFDTADAPFRHFFPPTAIAHRRNVIARVGGWEDPRDIRPPVDAEFLLRAAHAGMRFVPTGRITAHKFAAGHRYLSYLRVSSDEQREMLRVLDREGGFDIDGIVAASKQGGHYMAMTHLDYSLEAPGAAFERNRQNKGISRPALQPLRERTVMAMSDEPRALDWYGVETDGVLRYRFSGPNPRPTILIPYTGRGARIAIEVIVRPPRSELQAVALFAEDQGIDYAIETDARGVSWLVADISLRESDYSILTLETPMICASEIGAPEDMRKLGIAVGEIVLEPIPAGVA
jgi:hypothetical protein